MIEAHINVKPTHIVFFIYSVCFTKNATIRFGRPPMPSTNRSAKSEDDDGNGDPRGADK